MILYKYCSVFCNSINTYLNLVLSKQVINVHETVCKQYYKHFTIVEIVLFKEENMFSTKQVRHSMFPKSIQRVKIMTSDVECDNGEINK